MPSHLACRVRFLAKLRPEDPVVEAVAHLRVVAECPTKRCLAQATPSLHSS